MGDRGMNFRDPQCYDCHQITSGDCGQHGARILDAETRFHGKTAEEWANECRAEWDRAERLDKMLGQMITTLATLRGQYTALTEELDDLRGAYNDMRLMQGGKQDILSAHHVALMAVMRRMLNNTTTTCARSDHNSDECAFCEARALLTPRAPMV